MGKFKPQETDNPEVKRLELAMRMTELTKGARDPVALAKHFAFFYLSAPRPETLAADPYEMAGVIDELSMAFAIVPEAEADEDDEDDEDDEKEGEEEESDASD